MALTVLSGFPDINPSRTAPADPVSIAHQPHSTIPYTFFLFPAPLPTGYSFSMDAQGPPRLPSPDSVKPTRKKPASPERPPAQQVDFEFLNFSHPSEAKAQGARRTVRSHVTRQQHQKDQLAAAAARRSKSYNQTPEASSSSSPSTAASSTRTVPRLRTFQTASSDDTSFEQQPQLRSAWSEPGSAVTSLPSSLQHSPAASQSRQIDPLDVYPPEWHTSIPIVLDHYLTNLAAESPDLSGPRGQRLLHQVWLPFLLSDVTLLHSVMLLSASHCSSVRGSDAHSIDIITLRGMAIRSINDSLHDSAKAQGDELIAAVLNMASYEATFGDRETYAMHMHGLRKLVELKGGLSSLGLDGLLERMLLWVDSNASFNNGFDVFFPEGLFPSDSPQHLHSPHTFGGRRPSYPGSS